MSKTRKHTDQLNRTVEIPTVPQRIVSLVPSQTELLYDLGLNERVVGITKFCLHPQQWYKHKTRVGGTKQLNFETIATLKPDLIIANKEENNRADIEALARNYPVWISDIDDLDAAIRMIELVGEITHTSAQVLRDEIDQLFSKLQPICPQKKALYLIWKDPYMAAGTNTFIHDMLQRCGIENAVTQPRYPALQLNEIRALNPDLILLSSEPYPFSEKHIPALQALLPHAEIKLVDGEMFSWYGSRLKLAPAYFKTVFNHF